MVRSRRFPLALYLIPNFSVGLDIPASSRRIFGGLGCGHVEIFGGPVLEEPTRRKAKEERRREERLKNNGGRTMNKTTKSRLALWLCLLILFALGTANAAAVDYSDQRNWACHGNTPGPTQAVDVFFVGPTTFFGNAAQFNLPLTDSEARRSFLGAINMEKGIYDAKANFYAPYYRQAALNVYRMDAGAAVPYFTLAYQDVKEAFEHYLKHLNPDRPFILAGFSQGADMIVRLMKDKFRSPRLQERLVAAYAVGWRVTAEEISRYPQLRMARGEYDIGVIVSFNTEAPALATSLSVPVKTLGINPLNWKTTGEHADKSLNQGAVFIGYDGRILKEIPHLTGAYLDPVRGTVKVTDVDASAYPPVLDLFKPGEYHIYDYQFFYRNLQTNVRDRIDAYQQWNAIRPVLKVAN